MLKSLTGALVAVAAFGGLAASSTGASAMPMIDRAPAVATTAAVAGEVQEARWVCGPFRCFYRPNFYHPFYPAYGYGGGYGWHRWHRPYYGGGYGWHRWHRW